MALILPRSVMIHVPKTGGTWCAEAIKRAKIPFEEPMIPGSSFVQSRHCTINAVVDRIGDRLTFGFIRHPMTWLRSQWKYNIDREAYKKWKKPYNHWTAKCWSLDYITIVKRIIAKNKAHIPTNEMFKRLGFVVNAAEKRWERGPHAVKFIGRTEFLSGDLIEVLARAGEKFDLHVVAQTPPMRVSKAKVNREPSRKLVKKIEQSNSQIMDLLNL